MSYQNPDNKTLKKIRTQVCIKRPYLARAIYSLVPVEKEEVPTMGVDKWFRLYYNPEYLEEQDTDHLVGVLVHEINHLLREHHDRAINLGCDKEPSKSQIWNFAGDVEINDDLVEEGLLDVKKHGGLHPNQIGAKTGKTLEYYYKYIKKNSKKMECKGPGHGDCGSGADGRPRDYEEGEPGTTESDIPGVGEVEANAIRIQTARDIKSIGDVPGGLKRWADKFLEPNINPQEILRSALAKNLGTLTRGKHDYTYKVPSRRQAACPDIAMPSMVKPEPNIMVVIDTSGSMSEQDLGYALGTVNKILSVLAVPMNVLSCDSAVGNVQRIMSVRQVDLVGGGGTDMGKAIEEAHNQHPEPSVILVVTDGYTPWPDSKPKIPVIVAMTRKDQEAPGWAKTIHLVREQNEV